MSTWLNFNLSHRKKKKPEAISDPQIIYDGALCDNIISGSHFALTKQLQLRWCRNRKAASVCHLLLLLFIPHEKIGNMGEEKNSEDPSISRIGTFFLFSVRRKTIYCFLCWETVLLWYIRLYSGVSTKCYLNQWYYFGNIRINCKGPQSLEICHFERWNLCSQ